jgi:TatD DNase family protein
MFIDTHSHLFFQDYKDDLDEVIARAKSSGVDKIIVPSTDLPSAAAVINLVNKYDIVYGAIGVHPHDTKEWNEEIINQIADLADNKKIVAIGEIGLDYYYDFSPKEKQYKAFTAQLDLAIKLDLPVIIHNRDADEDVLNIIGSYCGKGLKAQFHCFSGSIKDAKELINMNHFISFTGNITYKKLDDLRSVAASIPLDNLLLETDSPFMTPVPFRGKRNEPSYINHVAEQVAKIHNTTIDEVAKITSFNAFRLFGIGSKDKTDFTYLLGDSLYVNVTNRCSANCTFCHRKIDPTIAKYNLRLNKADEPPADIYINEIGNPKNYKEIVFCGYGEPTIRWDVVKDICRYVKAHGGRTRINTNGHGNLINKRDITPEMKNIVDTLSISLNTTNAKQYSAIMQVDESYYPNLIQFIHASKQHVEKVVVTAVNMPEINIEELEKFAKDELGVEFRVRHYFE